MEWLFVLTGSCITIAGLLLLNRPMAPPDQRLVARVEKLQFDFDIGMSTCAPRDLAKKISEEATMAYRKAEHVESITKDLDELSANQEERLETAERRIATLSKAILEPAPPRRKKK